MALCVRGGEGKLKELLEGSKLAPKRQQRSAFLGYLARRMPTRVLHLLCSWDLQIASRCSTPSGSAQTGNTLVLQA